MSDQRLPAGDHEFEALGFEDCCDGHAELEIHIPCGAGSAGEPDADPWRVVHSGASTWIASTCMSWHQCPAPQQCEISYLSDDTASAGTCGEHGGAVDCVAAATSAPPPASNPIYTESTLANGDVRLSNYPQGRIEVFNTNTQGWGTVCGHWYWDNDIVADIVCKKVGLIFRSAIEAVRGANG